ncbi:hypothetical protein BCR44DRAFT_1432868 [Catenaria anguillulae PL171]|uniref:Uncharacterized protein n=1 Tax=Catenaria anguillulae PL171 TaxID=765915 RepID=A0A1Y2HNM2_9FUNG|nr:hypothetical protein BCR44DRAFT_1432868 [Catenaria anguillulae PL171]
MEFRPTATLAMLNASLSWVIVAAAILLFETTPSTIAAAPTLSAPSLDAVTDPSAICTVPTA